MQNPLGQQIDITHYLKVFWKRKWLIVLPAVFFPIAAGYYAMSLPDSYKSSTLILVTPQKVPENYVQSTVTTGIQERLHTISQQILSRTRLEQMIHEFNLFEKERQHRSPEEIIETMRSRIRLNVKQNNAFELAYVDHNPRLAMLVANKLASLFIEENLKVREQQAIGTSQFLADEIERYREKVREKEKIIYEFKQQHMREMPEQLSSNQSRLSQMQAQLQINSEKIIAAENRRVQLQQQLADIERRVEEQRQNSTQSDSSISDMLTQLLSGSQEGPSVETGTLASLQQEIERRESVLEAMLLQYTERHPDVVRLTGEIEKLREKVEEEKARIAEEQAQARETETEGGEPLDLPPIYPPVYDQIKADLQKTQAEVRQLTAHNEELMRGIEQLQGLIAATPGRQLQLQQLSEDYDNLKNVLESLTNKKLQADLSENLERKQKGEQFKVLDPANLPEKPFSPQRMRFVGGGLLAGLALGFGVVLLLDLLDTSVRTREELGGTVDAPVMAVIPEILTPAALRRRWKVRGILIGAVFTCVVAGVLIVHLSVRPIPDAVRDVYTQVKSTHWSTMR